MSEPTPSVTFKVIFIGCSGVGKTSIINQKKNGDFTVFHDPTVGAGYQAITVDLDNVPVHLNVWDTAGQEQFAPLVPVFVRATIVAVIVASISDYQSIQKIDYWIDVLHSNNENPQIIVVINKIDLENSVTASIKELHDSLGKKFSNIYFVSAKTGQGIEDLFTTIALCCMNMELPSIPQPSNIDSENDSNNNRHHSKGCC